MANVIINTEKFLSMLEDAFKKGEQWGVTYSTWFTPSEEDTKSKIDEIKKKSLEESNVPPYLIKNYLK